MRLVAFHWYRITYFMAGIKHKESFLLKLYVNFYNRKKRKKISKFLIFYFLFLIYFGNSMNSETRTEYNTGAYNFTKCLYVSGLIVEIV